MTEINITATIGLEIHVQLKTRSKMFCRCDNNAEGKKPNTVVCPVCMGMPGTLPVANEQALLSAVKLGRFLNGKIAPVSKFDRKHYFYPDLPKGYQISQYDMPIVVGGEVNLSEGTVHLTRIHLEEDAGKLIHPDGKAYSLVDLNRAGTPLVEIVTEPDIHTAEQAKALLQRLRLIVRYLDISEADMEKGHMRCDANISVSDSAKLGIPVEIKNLNSFLAVEKAIKFEINRQTQLLIDGESIAKETRGWNEQKSATISQRSKEHAPDYRYFPEPDLPPFIDYDQIKVDLPESIESKVLKAQNLKLSAGDITTLFNDDKLMALFDALLGESKSDNVLKRAINFVINIESARQLDTTFILELAEALESGRIGQPAIKSIIELGINKHIDVATAIADGGYEQISDTSALQKIIEQVIAENPQPVADIKAGKTAAMGYLTGQVMKLSRGQANPQMVNQLLTETIK